MAKFFKLLSLLIVVAALIISAIFLGNIVLDGMAKAFAGLLDFLIKAILGR